MAQGEKRKSEGGDRKADAGTGPFQSSIRHPDPGVRWKPGATVGIVGGLGEMGRLFSSFFMECGYRVLVADLHTPVTAREVVEASDMVLFAVPLHGTVSIIRGLVPHVKSDQLLMDVTSLKTGPVREMLASPASVVGLHPMFGGRVAGMSGQTMVACPVRIGAGDWAHVRGLFTSRGLIIKETSPEDHDRMMSIIQVLFHMTTMLIGRVLRDFSIDIGETMEYTSPSYRVEMTLLGRIFAQSPALYSAITMMNPHTGDILSALREGLEVYRGWYESEDLQGFMRDFERSAAHLGDFCRTAFEESSEMLDFSNKLANRKNGGKREG
jgi:prephenate dehydrogenase